MSWGDQNLHAYSSPQAVEKYSIPNELTACESYLFDKYVDRDQAILDLGVGGGRTTAHLAPQARLYVGLDYSQAMVDICRSKFPSLQFVCDDASNLQRFAADNFDVVIFSYNGIDCIRTDSERTRCFREVARVLRAGGYFILSSHNARSVGLRAHIRRYLLDRAIKPEQGAAKIRSDDLVVSKARSLAAEIGLGRFIWKILRTVRTSVSISLRWLHVPKAHRGTGYIFDNADGGLINFVSTPEYISSESSSAGFEVVEVVSNIYPADGPDYEKQWYYYVLRVGPK
jgi:SAM-dependent methyltransferase